MKKIVHSLICIHLFLAHKLIADEFNGEQYSSLIQMQLFSDHRFIRQLYMPLRPTARDCYSDIFCTQFEAWTALNGGVAYQEGDPNGRGFRIANGNVTLGANTYFTPCFLVGMAFDYEYDHINYRRGGSSHANAYQGAIYGEWQGPCFYVLADAIFTYQQWHTKREINLDAVTITPRSHFNIYHGAGYIEAGFDMCTGCLLIQPFIGIEGGHYHRDGAVEKSGSPFNLAIRSKNVWLAESRLGFHAAGLIQNNFTFSCDLAWRHRLSSFGDHTHTTMIATNDAFSFLGSNQSRHGVELVLNLSTTIHPKVTAFIEAAGEQWGGYSGVDVALGIDAWW